MRQPANWLRSDARARLLRSAKTVARFGVVGLLGTAVYYSILWVMVELLRAPVLVSSSVAFLIVCVENYVLHYRWTFDSSRAHVTTIPRFVFMNGVGFCINWGIMYVGVELLGRNYLFTQAVALVAVISWNFVLSSYWVFCSSRELGQVKRA